MTPFPATAVTRTPETSSAWRTLALTSVAVFVVSLDSTVLYVAFPAIRATFSDVSAAQLSWVLNAYTIVFGSLLVPAGRIADRIGRKRIFLLGLGLFTAASAVCGLAPSAAALIAARALQACGAALLLPSSLALVLHAFPPQRRASAVALWGAVGALAAAIGPSLGSFIIQSASWRWAFYINVPVGIAALLRGSGSLFESRDETARDLPDPLGIALLAFAIALVALGIVEGRDWGLLGPRTLASIGGGILLFAGFLLRLRRASSPAVDLSLFANRNYRLANVATFVFAIAFTAMFFTFVFFLTQRWHYSLLQAGLAITPGPLMVIPVAIVAGRIADRHGHRGLLVAGGLVFALGGALLYSALESQPDFLRTWLPRALVTGIGVGLVLPSLSGAAVHGLPPNEFALGSAINQAVRQIGAVIGVGLVIAVLARAGPSSDISGFVHISQVLIGGGVLTALACLGIRTSPRAGSGPLAPAVHERDRRDGQQHRQENRSGELLSGEQPSQ
jgi:EmrB/QacA subfamily drug resistance transporter